MVGHFDQRGPDDVYFWRGVDVSSGASAILPGKGYTYEQLRMWGMEAQTNAEAGSKWVCFKRDGSMG